jgi:hypothetical protein
MLFVQTMHSRSLVVKCRIAYSSQKIVWPDSCPSFVLHRSTRLLEDLQPDEHQQIFRVLFISICSVGIHYISGIIDLI